MLLAQFDMLRIYGNEADVERSDDDSAYGSDNDVYAYGAAPGGGGAAAAKASPGFVSSPAKTPFVYSIDALFMYGGTSKDTKYMSNSALVRDGDEMRFSFKKTPATEVVLLNDLCRTQTDGKGKVHGFTNVPLSKVVARGPADRWVQRGPDDDDIGNKSLVNIGGIFTNLLMHSFSQRAADQIHDAMDAGATKEHVVTLVATEDTPKSKKSKPVTVTVTLPPGIGNQTYRLLELIIPSVFDEPVTYTDVGSEELRFEALRRRGLDYCKVEPDQSVVGGRGTARLFRNLVLSAALRVVTGAT